MWFRILVLALGTFALGTDTFVVAGVLPDIAHQLNISVDVAGQLVSVFSLTYALGSPILGTFTGKMARKLLLLGSLALFVVANLIAAVATSFAVLLVARIIAACAAAVFTPTASAAAAALAPADKRARALSLVIAGMSVSLVMGVPLGILVGSRFGWHMTFLLIALLSALAFVGVLAFFPTIANPPIVGLRTRLGLLRRPIVIVTLVFVTFTAGGAFTIYTYLGPLLQERTHLDSTGISSMFLIYGLACMVGNAIGGYSADRWGTIRCMVLAALLVALALFALPFTAISFAGAALAITLWGIAAWCGGPAQQSRLISLAPEVSGELLSINVSAIYIGTAGGAALGGLTLLFAPLTALGWVGGSCELVALALALLSTRLELKPAPDSTQEPRVVSEAYMSQTPQSP